MSDALVSALTNAVAVAIGLFVLWSLVGRMRETSVGFRAGAAIFAGVVSAVVTYLVTIAITASA